jgi:alkanesulfonate monooxygenase SsuD/methylene tetrahydromethanopterin reductase-like flavin-dependent oxidoreductase (luciferase family)
VERSVIESYRRLSFVGTPASVRQSIEALVAESGADEVMVTSIIYDPVERLRSFELLADAFGLAVRPQGAKSAG